MKLLILGASRAQMIGITTAKALGHQVVVCDYLSASPGHRLADVSSLVSTFDTDGVLSVADQEGVDGIMTLGTDQPVLTAAKVSHALNLPMVLSTETALAATNKEVMKQRFLEADIPTVDYILYEKGLNDDDLNQLQYPVVVKPLDSQGQRGIYYLDSASEVVDHYESVVQYSRQSKILVEAYYEHDEITVSGWVQDGTLHVLSITDRVTFAEKDQIGICLSHELPSRHMKALGSDIIALAERITEMFSINAGPVYYQILLGEEGLKVNEIACRIGGAHEATFLPRITDFDITEAAINSALGIPVDTEVLEGYDVLNTNRMISVQLFFCEPCVVARVPGIDDILGLEGVIDYHMHLKVGDQVGYINNATSRAGFAVIEASDEESMKSRVQAFFVKMGIIGEDGINHMIGMKWRQR